MQRIARHIASFSLSVWFSLVVNSTAVLYGQPYSSDSLGVKVSGTVMLSADMYSMDALPEGTTPPRRPSSLLRLVATPTVQIGEFVLPFSFVVSSRQTNSTTPALPTENPIQFLQNPLQHVSFSPRWKWAQLHMGTYTPRYSVLSTGNLSAFGAGFDIQPNGVRVAAFGGVVQRAVEPDSSRSIVGAYERWLYAARLGIGSEHNGVGVNVVRRVDMESSLQRAPEGVFPQEGLLASIDVGVEPMVGLRLSGEGAASVYTRNTRAKKVEKSDVEFLQSLITLRESSRIDGAAALSLAYSSAEWGATLAAKYLGDGFVPLGYAYVQTDRIEVTLSPRLLLLSRRLSLSGSLGYRKNNISQTGVQTSLQLLGSVQASAQISENFSLAGTYANYGIRSRVRDDTLRYEMVSQSASITPVYTFGTPVGQHRITVALSLDDIADENALTGVRNHSNTYAALLNYALTFSHLPLTGTVALNGLRSKQALGTTLWSAVVGGVYRLENGDVVPSARLSLTRATVGTAYADTRISAQAGIAWKLLPSTVLRVTGSVSVYHYGAVRGREQFRESFVQTSIATQL